jgi:hypothetical protein
LVARRIPKEDSVHHPPPPGLPWRTMKSVLIGRQSGFGLGSLRLPGGPGGLLPPASHLGRRTARARQDPVAYPHLSERASVRLPWPRFRLPPVAPDMEISSIRRCQPTRTRKSMGLSHWAHCTRRLGTR